MKKSLMGVRSTHIWNFALTHAATTVKGHQENFSKLTCRKSSPKESGLRVAREPILSDMMLPMAILPLGLYHSQRHERPLIIAICESDTCTNSLHFTLRIYFPLFCTFCTKSYAGQFAQPLSQQMIAEFKTENLRTNR